MSPKSFKLFRDVVGALVVAQEPININTLASLLYPEGSQFQEFTSLIRRTILNRLQAVLVVPGVNSADHAADAQPIQFIHTSFVDYLTDETQCESRLLVHPPEPHELLAVGCFRNMDSLKRNMCDLDPCLLNSEVKNFDQRVWERILPALRYACVHIAGHVSQTNAGNAHIRGLIARFARERLIYWLECLSLLGKAHEGVGMVGLIEEWLK
ncbi:hypothetical protein FRB94_009475, partial [Tulasnella sp. JGI-2019a]